MSSPALTTVDATFAPAVDPVVELPAPPEPVACPECAATVVDSYCARCGEARPVPDGLRVRHLLGELFEHLTSLDFKLVRTLVALVRRPGSITRDFVLGRRSRYTRPLALYLLVSGAFFLASSQLPVGLTSARRLVLGVRGDGTADVFEKIAARTGETRVQLADRVGRSPLVQKRAVAAFIVPSLALLLALLHVRRRRLATEHVLLAIHLQTFLFLAIAGAGLVAAAFGLTERMLKGLGLAPDGTSTPAPMLAVASVACVGTAVAHLHAALRRVYGLGRAEAAWRAVAIAVALPVMLAFTQLLLIVAVALAH